MHDISRPATFARRLRQLREAHGLTVRQLARLAHVGEARIVRHEEAKVSKIRFSFVMAVRDVLGAELLDSCLPPTRAYGPLRRSRHGH